MSALISTIAGRQHNFITRAQLLGLRLSRRAITARLHACTLTAVHAGVYAVGAVPTDPCSQADAAVLACGPDAVLSHDSAAALWGLRRWPRTPEVTAPTEKRRPRIHTHCSSTLSRADVTTNYGIRVTTIVRTIIDINPRLTDRQLTRVINDARVANRLKPSRLGELLRRCSRARRLIDPEQNPTRSRLEDDFARWIKRHRLPMPTINARIGGREVDALFEAERVIVELDSWTFHRDRLIFENDRERDTAHRDIGYETVRITPDRLTKAEADRLRRILEARRPS
ncbi:MAG: hypothetical protein ACR2NR_12625 [Solirubrobacteraceae bacterium]